MTHHLRSDKEKEAEPKKAAPKKVQAGKLEEREIDTSNIKIEKKEEKKAITTWVVDADKVKDLTRKDFVFKEVETDFESLTNDQINEELKQVSPSNSESSVKPEAAGGSHRYYLSGRT